MKRLHFLPVSVFFLLVAYGLNAQSTKNSFTINGKIAGKANGKLVYLKTSDNKREILDSTVIKNNRFTFHGNVEYPQLYNIVIAKNDTPARPGYPLYQPVVPVFVENAKIEIAAILDSIPQEDYMYYGGYNFEQVDITGSATQKEYVNFLKAYQPLADKRSNLFMDEYIKYLNPEEGKEKGPVSEGVAIVTKLDEAAAERDAFVKNYISNHDDVIGLYVATDKLATFSVKEIDEIVGGFSPALMNSPAGMALKEKAMEVKKTASGANYADFSFNDDKGNPVKLSDHLGKGKYVLLEFWASWCGPCRADIPHLKEVYSLYHPAGFDVVSVSMDDDKEKWLQAIKEEGMSWPQVSDLQAFDGNLSKLYNFNGIPTCLLIDPEGKIVTRNMRGSWMDKKLIELYGNKFGDKF